MGCSARMSDSVRVRFAPGPSDIYYVGNVCSGLGRMIEWAWITREV
ncbi:hypothetical protein ES707_05148 [subsurface metagenome]